MTREPKTSRAEREIDANLKRAYEDVLNQEVPDRFTDLLAQLRAAEDKRSGSKSGADNA